MLALVDVLWQLFEETTSGFLTFATFRNSVSM